MVWREVREGERLAHQVVRSLFVEEAVEEALGEKQLANGKLVDANLVIGEQEALNQIRSIKSFLQEAFCKNGNQKSVDVSKIWWGKSLCK
jgi:hypothetical protein